jgi:hypothetical protein
MKTYFLRNVFLSLKGLQGSREEVDVLSPKKLFSKIITIGKTWQNGIYEI